MEAAGKHRSPNGMTME